MLQIVANKKERIDKYLNDEIDMTRTKIQRLIKNGNILVNGIKIKNNYILKENDQINIDECLEEENNLKEEKMDLDIIYEDDDIIIVNKASGIVVHPAPGHLNGTLVNGLLDHTKSLSNDKVRPGIVHRIDKDTSGLLIISKNEKAHLFLTNEIKEHKIKRTYIALVDGVINHDTGTIDAPIGRDSKNRKRMSVTDINSKTAITHFKVLKRYEKATLIECDLETGRTHQIRVHLKYIGHPIINDPTYNNRKLIDDYGQLLHAKKLVITHPRTLEKMTFECDLPNKFKEILKKFE